MSSLPVHDRVRTWERAGLWLLAVAFVGFAVFIEVRTCFLKRRMGDVNVFFRAAWAARQGGSELYSITCDNGWHYHYPPTFAIALMPLADPPRGVSDPLTLPFPILVLVWYVLSLACLAMALHQLASALEATASVPVRPGERRWWTLRVLPLLACLPLIGGSLVRGQVSLLLLALLCGYLVQTMQGRRFAAGLFLAGAICLKIIPIVLLLLPTLRREGRTLFGCALGLGVGLILVPVVVFGPRQAMLCYQQQVAELLAPGLGVGEAASRSRELIDATATDSQSFQSLLHNTLYLDRATRPRTVSPSLRLAHWCLGGFMMLLTLGAYHHRAAGQEGRAFVLLAGSFFLIMILLSPVCHLHYFALLVPLLMALIAPQVWQSTYPGRGWMLLLTLYLLVCILPLLPRFRLLRDVGLVTYGALLLWGAACVTLVLASRRGAAPGHARRLTTGGSVRRF